ncbi:cellulose biosynthesis protein BcsS [Hyphomicrobium sp. CS1GBMeth3]|uniref:cellulose biosynthesis protein BcsS n=1 Tax=Hyphomicrobium sp. CS1GBMeth3 TaxID=1892845 RepID=UPI0009304D82|nr:cellulose biosynthesis protein BcsS [Hyphomicrobium sp. CS1GBMeth3]
MKKRVVTSTVGGLALALMSSVAHADGMPSLKDTVVEPAAPTWSGMYFGGSVGYGWNESKNRYRDSTGTRQVNDEDADGGLVSLVWGYDCQWDRFVFGGFVDVDWSDISRGSVGDGLTIDRSFSIGARIGALVTPNTLAFVTAGYTRAHFDNDGWWTIPDDTTPGTTIPGRSGAYFNGYFIGGGLETRLSGNFFLRGEVRYADFSSEISNAGTAGDGVTTYVDKEDPYIVTTRLGLIYKLGGREPWHGTSDGKYKVISYTGVDVAKDIWTIYSGNLFALNGDFERNGFLFRTFGFYSDYDLDAGTFEANAKDRSLDAMLGYLYYFGQFSAAAYVGMEVRDIDLSPEAQTVDETETGFKVAFELETVDSAPYYLGFDTSYSTAFDTYFALLRVGFNRDGWKYGPESEVWSEDGDTTWRLGAFLKLPVNILPNLPTELTLSGGHQWVDDDGDSDSFLAGAHGGEGAYFNSMIKIVY